MKNFKFIDLFAGLGGFRVALEAFGGECVFSAEINSHACDIYKANFHHDPYCDITKLNPSIIPDFDVLCAGFPCQAFSIAGKKLGFEDTRGTLFFDVCRVIQTKKPSIVLLENVKHLTQHDNGKTFSTIISSLENLNYSVSFKLLNAKDFGVPQHRERIIIVAVNKDFSSVNFDFSSLHYSTSTLSEILEDTHHTLNSDEYTLIDDSLVKKQKSGLIFCGYRNKNIRKVGIKENSLHLSRTHKQPNRIYHINGNHPTLSSQESSGRYFVFDGQQVFQLTLLECFRLMGFPDSYIKIGSKSNLYNRIGNSVCVSMISSVMKSILDQY